jgi:molybdenum cofactor cytidylyltransferase
MTRMIPGVVLAAGASSRMGRSKALLPTGVAGETFLSRILATLRAADLQDLVVVTGPDADVERALERDPALVRIARNPAPERGQLSSLQLGLALVDRPGVSAMLVTLVDVPLVAPDTVRTLVAAYRTGRALVARPARGGRHGHPVIFDRAVFDALRQADPEVGAKAVLRAHADRVLDVPIEDEGAFLDVDTPADYARAFGRAVPGDGAWAES